MIALTAACAAAIILMLSSSGCDGGTGASGGRLVELVKVKGLGVRGRGVMAREDAGCRGGRR